jgi:hypothetical protein
MDKIAKAVACASMLFSVSGCFWHAKDYTKAELAEIETRRENTQRLCSTTNARVYDYYEGKTKDLPKEKEVLQSCGGLGDWPVHVFLDLQSFLPVISYCCDLYWRELGKRMPQFGEGKRLRKAMEFRRFLLELARKGERKVVVEGAIFVCISGNVVYAEYDCKFWDRKFDNWKRRKNVKPLAIDSILFQEEKTVEIHDSGWGLVPGQIATIVRDCYVIGKVRIIKRDSVFGEGSAKAEILEQTCSFKCGDQVILSLEDSKYSSLHVEQIPNAEKNRGYNDVK